MSDELARLRQENDRLKEERRAHNQEWQDQVMSEFGKVNAQISGLRAAIESPDTGVKIRLAALEQDKREREKKLDKVWVLWLAAIPILGDIGMRVYEHWIKTKP